MLKRPIHLMLAVLMGAVFGVVSSQSAQAVEPTVYNQPGDHHVNGRYWKTSCEMYSPTVVRCSTDIFATKVVKHNGSYYNHNGWVFNNLTYLPSGKAQWKGNPLAKDTEWTAKDGRKWRTECNTAATGQGGCRSYIWSTEVISKNGKFVKRNDWKFNNIVQFATRSVPAQSTILPKAPAIATMPVEKKFTAPSAPAAGSVDGSCSASYYWQPQMTATGERFDPSAMTAAHKTLKFGSKVKVTNPSNGKSVVVRINDRGPYIQGRCLDLSKAAMTQIGGISAGHIKVDYEIVG